MKALKLRRCATRLAYWVLPSELLWLDTFDTMLVDEVILRALHGADFRSAMGGIEVPALSGCTHVGRNALSGCLFMRSLRLPLCKTVEMNAFACCFLLESAELLSCLELSVGAFYQCESLVSVSAPLCQSVQDTAFNGCTVLQEVYMPSCRNISMWAFRKCPALRKVTVAKDCFIDKQAFDEGVRVEVIHV